MGKWLIVIGLVLVALGLLLQFAPWALHWFGRLPGDIRIESDKGRVLIPITSMLIISVLLSLILHFFLRR